MSKEIMLECLRDAKWVFTQYDRAMNDIKAKGAYSRSSLAIIAVALYEERMLQVPRDQNNATLPTEDASWLRGL